MVKVKPIEKKEGMLNDVRNWLYRLDDIQNAMSAIGLSEHNEKLFDELIGFPNKEDKTIGEAVLQDETWPQEESYYKQELEEENNDTNKT